MDILAMTLPEVEAFLDQRFNKGRYHAAALYREIFKSGNRRFDRAGEFKASPNLAQRLSPLLILSPGRIEENRAQGHLTKFITRLQDNERIESVIIPMTRYQTLCVSSQVGCRMGCRFCETGKMGLKRNLTAAEICGQVFNARHVLKADIKNIVFMGMGEPLDNFTNVLKAIRVMNQQQGFDIAYRHMTLSTAGMAHGIEMLAQQNIPGLRLAVSINSADEKKRAHLMPINQNTGLRRLKQVLLTYPLPKRGTFLFEYILIKNYNDALEDAIKLADYIKPLPVRLNLIAYNPVDGFDYSSPDDTDMHGFAAKLAEQGIFVVKRWSKGRSVSAGCGQLGRNLNLTEPGLCEQYRP